MSEALTFGNAEADTKAHLDPLLSVPVLRVLTDPLPAQFVRIMLTGTSRRSLSLADARVTLECWAESDADAEALARETYGRMCAFKTATAWVPDGPDGWAGGPYADVDPDTDRPRYVMTAIVRQAAHAL